MRQLDSKFTLRLKKLGYRKSWDGYLSNVPEGYQEFWGTSPMEILDKALSCLRELGLSGELYIEIPF